MKKRIISLLLALVLAFGMFPLPSRAASSQKKLAAITFDDGPSKYTDGLLDELAKRGVTVTFFMQGRNAEAYPSVVKKAYESGHQIASHTYNHPQLPKLSDAKIKEQLSKTAEILNSAVGADSAYMLRPPYGSTNARVLAAIGTPAINWSVDTRDWESRNADKVYKHIINDTKDGSIVLLHDLYATSVSGALRGIDALLEQGYELVTVRELLRRRGIDPADGKMYYNAHGDTTLPGIAPPSIMYASTIGGQLVTLSADEGTKIYYTTDGSAPTSQSSVYTGPFQVPSAGTVRAFAARDLNGGRSGISGPGSEQPDHAPAVPEQPQCAPPVITIENGLASISSGGDVLYTLDGSAPVSGSVRYAGPFSVPAGTMIRAIAVEAGYADSPASSLLYSAQGNLFSDVEPSKWYYHDVDSAAAAGMMPPDGRSFRPEDPATRREVVQVLYHLAGRPANTAEVAFSDLAYDDPSRDAIGWAVERQVLSGFSDGTVRPDESVTREQLAVMLYRVRADGAAGENPSGALSGFSDAGSISGYAVDAVGWAVSSGILNGVSAAKFSPAGTVSRAQLAAIALRFQPGVSEESTKPSWLR